MRILKAASVLFLVTVAAFLPALAQNRPRSTADAVRGHFASINKKILEMTKDFPEDKYNFKPKPEMRSFSEALVHIASGNVYAAKAGRGEKVNWDELDPKNYKSKAEVVALMEKSISDASATLKTIPDEAFVRSVEPWLGVTEHNAEHYGQLVVYYREAGLVPPASRSGKN
jgi:uncharacterized damage-inducible protein DinB